MPGWWYAIESNTTKHAITQFEHACREALSSDRPTRELMRATSAKQRFPVIEWIKKLDKLQSTAIKMSERSRKRSAIPSRRSAGGNKFRRFFGVPSRTSRRGHAGLGIPPSLNVPTLSAGPRNSPQRSNFRRESSANSRGSDRSEDLYDPAGNGTQTQMHTHLRNVSDSSLNVPGDDANLLVPSSWTHGIIEPPPKGSRLSRSLSLGTRLGPGHARAERQSTSTIEFLDENDEEEYYVMPDGLDQPKKTPFSGISSGAKENDERSSDESDDAASDTESLVYEFNPQRTSARGMHHHGRHPTYFGDPYNSSGRAYSFDVMTTQTDDIGWIHAVLKDPESSPTAQSNEDYERVLTSRPITPNLNDFTSSQLSLASVTAGRDDFALSKVEDLFTDADGKYLKQFSSELCKLDPKASKDDLCIREYIVRSEKQWSNDMRNKKWGFHPLRDLSRPSTQASNDRPMSISPPESLSEEPLVRYKPPKGIKRFLQRRIGDWPLYSFLLALVTFLQKLFLIGRARS